MFLPGLGQSRVLAGKSARLEFQTSLFLLESARGFGGPSIAFSPLSVQGKLGAFFQNSCGQVCAFGFFRLSWSLGLWIP